MKTEEKGSTFDARSITKMSICVALLCISAYIAFPVPFAAAVITALTITMNLTAFILPPKQTFLVLLVYVLLGAAGLPVYANGASGIGQLFGPTGGFLIAFVIAYPVVSWLKGADNSFRRYLLVAVCVGIPITYIGGLISMMLVLHLSLMKAVVVAVLPFLPGDILKSAAAAWLSVRLNKIFAQWE
mgnify:CR=1 FL=1